MPTAKKLPSGSWRCQVFSHYELVCDEEDNPVIDEKTGKQKQRRVYESFTCEDPTKAGKRRAEAMAAEFADKKDDIAKPVYRLTFGEALERYIKERNEVLSPASIRKYKSMQRNCMVPLMDYKLKNLTQDIIQGEINTAAIKKSPKTVRDMNGLITAVMNRYRPDLRLQITLPKKLRPDIYIPSESDIKALMSAVNGTDMEVPVMLAAYGAMRRGEISAFNRKTDFEKNTIHISKTMVLNADAKWIIKAPKSYAGDRYVTFPSFVGDKIRKMQEDTVGLTPNDITNRFKTILKHTGLVHFRFHDLRHYNASIQHALGTPDAYIMESGGWGNDSVLKEVYRHALPEVRERMTNKALDYFEKMQHDMQHDTQQSQ
ncbi:site-specific integrase [Faecalicatena contorta]|uniref:Phage integrase family protein n=1 Tax=Faecalicatena contorta TaxID=39482 RepID=A0A315ZVH1_9FIRM|nr:site-specific integrase [Faecalicatena contorta]PWJ49309.1 phage integrase family protein [Faecalicatena contorta]SUQ14553.1 Phage integrase family protein [Faecalicatena contorta]